MRFVLTLLFGFFIYHTVLATAQVPDYLICQGDTVAIFSNPLEQFFEETGERALIDFVGCGSTACWRGYKAIWELKNDSLFLKRITSCMERCGLEIKDANLVAMFGTSNVFAYWFTGKIRIPEGERVYYVHMGYSSVYERERHLLFKKGIKRKEKVVANDKVAEKVSMIRQQRELIKVLKDTLFNQVKTSVKWDTIDTAWFDLCDEKYILTYSKRGRLKKVWVDWEGETFGEKINDWWWNITEDRKCRKTIKKALKPINISYLELPSKKLKVPFEILYNRKTGELELWKEAWEID